MMEVSNICCDVLLPDVNWSKHQRYIMNPNQIFSSTSLNFTQVFDEFFVDCLIGPPKFLITFIDIIIISSFEIME